MRVAQPDVRVRLEIGFEVPDASRVDALRVGPDAIGKGVRCFLMQYGSAAFFLFFYNMMCVCVCVCACMCVRACVRVKSREQR